jgi:Flp pilus assembly protein TadD
VQAAGQLEKAVESRLNERTSSTISGSGTVAPGRLPQAVANYQKALKSDNNLAEAHLNLGFAYERMKRTAQAKPEYQEACRLKAASVA